MKQGKQTNKKIQTKTVLTKMVLFKLDKDWPKKLLSELHMMSVSFIFKEHLSRLKTYIKNKEINCFKANTHTHKKEKKTLQISV